jgi:hypothetical protein
VSSGARTQEDRILWQLQASYPEWTPAPVLCRISLQYSSRIFSLRRKKGWQIENKVEIRDGVKHGFFRLATPGTFPNPTMREKTEPLNRKAETLPESGSGLLFDKLPERMPPYPD